MVTHAKMQPYMHERVCESRRAIIGHCESLAVVRQSHPPLGVGFGFDGQDRLQYFLHSSEMHCRTRECEQWLPMDARLAVKLLVK